MDDLIADFLVETNESIAKLDINLINLEQNPEDPVLLNEIFRVMHTIKGTCGFLGLSKLESLAHAAENVLGKIRDQEISITPSKVSTILKSIDTIKDIIKHIEDTNGTEPDTDYSSLLSELNSAANNTATSNEVKQSTDINQSQENAKDENNNVTFAEVLNDIDRLISKKSDSQEDEVINHDQATSPTKKNPEKITTSNNTQSSNTSIRVNINVLEGLIQSVSELILIRNQLLQLQKDNDYQEFKIPLQRLNLITSELQDKTMRTRMQPIGQAWIQFPRIVRDLSLECGKKIELIKIGEDTELDRQLIESIKDPLVHMIRNSIDHGIESPEERIRIGKKEVGQIILKAYHESGYIIIEVSDDGKGLSTEKIKEKIIANQLLSEEEVSNLTNQQIHQFIFHPGLSTAANVTAISGRGVGMDVVKSNIEAINGSIDLISEEGKGSTFIIKIPLTLAIMPILTVESAGNKLGIPQISIAEMIKIEENSPHKIENINDRMILRLRNNLLPIISLETILFPSKKLELIGNKYFIVICKIGLFSFGIIVDHIFNTEEIVVKPISPLLENVNIYSGSTLLGDGSVIMILDPAAIAKYISNNFSKNDNNTDKDNYLGDVDNKKAKFLIFKAGSSIKAIPIDVILRLEEIDTQLIETSMGNKVIQYNDSIMPIIILNSEYGILESGLQHIIVFSDKGKMLGVAVENIIDIAETSVDSFVDTKEAGFAGSILINNTTTDVIDLNFYFNKAFKSSEDQYEINNNLNQKTILFIDDSPFFRKFIPPSLTKYGYHVITVENVTKALEVLDSDKQIDLIITDINMPNIDGVEFTKICKQNIKYKNTPIIALSANFNGYTYEATEHNTYFDAQISKTKHNELIAEIEKLLNSNIEERYTKDA